MPKGEGAELRAEETAAVDEERLVELAERCERESRHLFPQWMRDGHAYHPTAYLLDKAAATLRSLSTPSMKE